MKIEDGRTVTIDYTMSLESGEVIDSTEETDPLTYIQGEGEIIAGLERQLLGRQKGDRLETSVPAEEGFGKSDPEALIEIPKSHLPPEGVAEGTELQGEGPEGQAIDGKVVEIRENSAVVDFNHPLAGKTLNFTVNIVDVQ